MNLLNQISNRTITMHCCRLCNSIIFKTGLTQDWLVICVYKPLGKVVMNGTGGDVLSFLQHVFKHTLELNSGWTLFFSRGGSLLKL